MRIVHLLVLEVPKWVHRRKVEITLVIIPHSRRRILVSRNIGDGVQVIVLLPLGQDPQDNGEVVVDGFQLAEEESLVSEGRGEDVPLTVMMGVDGFGGDGASPSVFVGFFCRLRKCSSSPRRGQGNIFVNRLDWGDFWAVN